MDRHTGQANREARMHYNLTSKFRPLAPETPPPDLPASNCAPGCRLLWTAGELPLSLIRGRACKRATCLQVRGLASPLPEAAPRPLHPSPQSVPRTTGALWAQHPRMGCSVRRPAGPAGERPTDGRAPPLGHCAPPSPPSPKSPVGTTDLSSTPAREQMCCITIPHREPPGAATRVTSSGTIM
ncbi:hypothetical protein HJG60_009105 [Phyllostomus discolor]|uniref:Uncharacterized protein n=1 Tax=Phyllostomus discolor TaxID=89673 RepID=A0A833YFD4_9CHIR|nr:hypothetical protein HJG60_009105 [Phyllostomus discolor]